jgi:hypothetical protein
MATFPIIVGCRRSGVSLLKVMFASHPQVAVLPDTSFIASLISLHTATSTFDPDTFVDQLYREGHLADWQLPRIAVEDLFRADPPTNYPAAVRQILSIWTGLQYSERYVDGTHGSIDHLPVLTQLFPEAKVVHVVRDGRHVGASMLELGLVDRLEDAAMLWRRQVEETRRTLLSLPTGRHYEVRYEDLVSAPVSTLQAVCHAVDLEFHEDMLDYQPLARRAVHAAPRPHEHRYLAHPVRNGLRDWQRDLPGEAVDRFDSQAGGLLRELGYGVRRPRLPVPTRLAAHAHRRGWRRRLRTRQPEPSSGGRGDHGLAHAPSRGRRPQAP